LVSENVADREQHTEWTAIFDGVLFPMTLRLLKPEVYQVDPFGMNDTRAHAASLLCKIFLRYLDRLVEVGRMKDVWMKVLELLDRLMNAGAEGDALAEAVLEGVKNVLLVMDGTGYLARDEATATATAVGHESHIPPPPPPPVLTEGDIGAAAAAEKETIDGGSEKKKQEAKKSSEEDGVQQIWPETVRRLDRFLPGLVQELFPPPPPDPTEARKAETSDESQAKPEDATS
jgi:brefeldin A-resistance guanine nucleotide exchange factor 1